MRIIGVYKGEQNLQKSPVEFTTLALQSFSTHHLLLPYSHSLNIMSVINAPEDLKIKESHPDSSASVAAVVPAELKIDDASSELKIDFTGLTDPQVNTEEIKYTEWRVLYEKAVEERAFRLEVSLSSPYKRFTDSVTKEVTWLGGTDFSFRFKRHSVVLKPHGATPEERFRFCNWLALNPTEMDWLVLAIVGLVPGGKDRIEDNDTEHGGLYRSLEVSEYIAGRGKYLCLIQQRINQKDTKVLIPFKQRDFVLMNLRAALAIIKEKTVAAAEA